MMSGKKEIWARAGKPSSSGNIFISLFAVLGSITITRHPVQEAGMLHVCAEEDMPPPFLGPWYKDTDIPWDVAWSRGCAELASTQGYSQKQREQSFQIGVVTRKRDWIWEKSPSPGSKSGNRTHVKNLRGLHAHQCQQPLFWFSTKHLCFPFSEKKPFLPQGLRVLYWHFTHPNEALPHFKVFWNQFRKN